MDILGIGPLELVFILIIILIVMGPRDIVKTSKVVGKFLRQVMTHPTFRLVQDTSREIRNLPYRLAREAGVDDLQEELKDLSELPKISSSPLDESRSDLGTWGESDPGRAAGEEPLPDVDTPDSETIQNDVKSVSQPARNDDKTEDNSEGQPE